LENILRAAWNQSSLSFDVRAASAQCNGSQAFDYVTAALTRAQELGITGNYSALSLAFGGGHPGNINGNMSVLAQVWNEAPPPLAGSSLQLTTIQIFLEQLRRVQGNDPNWYSLPHMRGLIGTTFYPILAGTTLADVMYRNTQIQPCPSCTQDTSVFWKA
jgi:hypothetical protein